jgi:hypothetical protein
MSDRELSIVAGALAKAVKPKATQAQDAIARRWRAGNAPDVELPHKDQDVIPLLAGWIRRLEREAGADAIDSR